MENIVFYFNNGLKHQWKLQFVGSNKKVRFLLLEAFDIWFMQIKSFVLVMISRKVFKFYLPHKLAITYTYHNV